MVNYPVNKGMYEFLLYIMLLGCILIDSKDTRDACDMIVKKYGYISAYKLLKVNYKVSLS